MEKTDLRETISFKAAVLVILAAAVVFAFILGNVVGTMDISVSDIIDTVSGNHTGTNNKVIWNIRLPRMILAALVGINLALSGSILQGVMKNPLADPSIIGISSGAGLFGIVILVIFPQWQNFVPIAAFGGAMLAAAIIYLLAWKGGIDPTRIVLSGVAVSELFGAGISATLVFFSDRVHGALTFMNGSLSSRSCHLICFSSTDTHSADCRELNIETASFFAKQLLHFNAGYCISCIKLYSLMR